MGDISHGGTQQAKEMGQRRGGEILPKEWKLILGVVGGGGGGGGMSEEWKYWMDGC